MDDCCTAHSSSRCVCTAYWDSRIAKDDSPRTGVSSSSSTRTRPLRNWPGKKRSDEFSNKMRNLSNLRPPCGAMEPTSLKRDISLRGPSRRKVYKLLDDAVLSRWIFPLFVRSFVVKAAAVALSVNLSLGGWWRNDSIRRAFLSTREIRWWIGQPLSSSSPY